jgi:hypothetical protein
MVLDTSADRQPRIFARDWGRSPNLARRTKFLFWAARDGSQRPFDCQLCAHRSSWAISRSGVFVGRSRAFLGLVLLLALRQVMQALCALPPPPNMIWRNPGFPSLFVTYNVGNDFFFSGHTAIAVFGAIELSRMRRRWLTALGFAVVIFEVATVLTLRAHYTMDVFSGAVTALWVSALCDSVGPRLDRVLGSAKI